MTERTTTAPPRRNAAAKTKPFSRARRLLSTASVAASASGLAAAISPHVRTLSTSPVICRRSSGHHFGRRPGLPTPGALDQEPQPISDAGRVEVSGSDLRRLERRESIAGAAGERDGLLALVAVDRLAQCDRRLVAAAGGLEHLRQVAE